MINGKFENDCYFGLTELFQIVSNVKDEGTVRSCLRHMIDLPEKSFGKATLTKLNCSLLPKCLHNPTKLSAYITYLEKQAACYVPDNIIMLKLYGYVQCIEVKYIYKVVGNLLGELGGGPTSGDIYDDIFSTRECFNDIKKRHECVTSTSSSKQRLAIVDLWSSFLKFDLRNAISHSDFIMNNEKSLIVFPSYIFRNLLKPRELQAKKISYTFSEIDDLYSKANDFNEAFKRVITDHGVNLGSKY